MKRSDIAKLYAMQQARTRDAQMRRAARGSVPADSGMPDSVASQRGGESKQFEKFAAAELYCPKCKVANPVKERLLLVLPDGELYEYRCQKCGTSVGQRRVK